MLRRTASAVPWYHDLVLHRLLRGQDLDEPAAEGVELVGVGDMAVQADRVELGQDEDPVQPEWMQLEIGMSIRRYLPAIGTAGLLRDLVSG